MNRAFNLFKSPCPFILIPCLCFFTLFFTACDDSSDDGDEGGDPLTYTLNDDGTAYSVTGCDKSATKISIPATYKKLPVTAIGYRALEQCKNLTSVTIPESVTTIGVFAFWGCSSLSSINLPTSITEISTKAFSDCLSLTSLIIPEGVTTIGSCAFEYCIYIENITIPASVTSIGDAFYQWTSDQTIYIQGYADEAAAEAAWGSSWQSTNGAKFVYLG